jgi:hypothetical protein
MKSVITFKLKKTGDLDPEKIMINDEYIDQREKELKSMMRAKTVTNEDLRVEYTTPDGLYI